MSVMRIAVALAAVVAACVAWSSAALVAGVGAILYAQRSAHIRSVT